MRRQFIQRILGIFLLIFSLTLIPPMLVSIGYRDGELPPFAVSFALTLVLGILMWLPTRGLRGDLRRREGFMVVALFWIMFSALGTLPLLFGARIGVADAIFEVVSGVTTTGATVLTGLDHMPQSLLYYRAQLQWFGGMGLIVFAVAILPMLGIGGMQLYRAETPGPMKDDKLAPRIASSARTLWYIYAGLTAACAVGFWLTGMNAIARPRALAACAALVCRLGGDQELARVALRQEDLRAAPPPGAAASAVYRDWPQWLCRISGPNSNAHTSGNHATRARRETVLAKRTEVERA